MQYILIPMGLHDINLIGVKGNRHPPPAARHSPQHLLVLYVIQASNLNFERPSREKTTITPKTQRKRNQSYNSLPVLLALLHATLGLFLSASRCNGCRRLRLLPIIRGRSIGLFRRLKKKKNNAASVNPSTVPSPFLFFYLPL